MTGEITLRGKKCFQLAELKKKLLAAVRAEIKKTVILCEEKPERRCFRNQPKLS